MPEPRDRLTRLIELASENAPEKQAALAFELCDLLVDWPPRYPQIMREPFEALLEKVLRRLDETTRRLIATRLSTHSETAVALLNECYFDVPTKARSLILERNHEEDADEPLRVDAEGEKNLVAAARKMGPIEFVHTFAEFLGVTPVMAQSILEDASGDALAVACRGAHKLDHLFRARHPRGRQAERRCDHDLSAPCSLRYDAAKRRAAHAQPLAPRERRAA